MIDLTKTPSQKFSKKLANIKFSQLIIKDLEKQSDVVKMNLKTHYLLQSYIINLVAVWQVFVEDLLKYAVDEYIKSNSDPNTAKNLKFKLKRNLKIFNTPNTKNIDKIFKNVLGIEGVTSTLEFEGMNSEKAKDRINKILKIRHKIAHTGYSEKKLKLKENFDFMKHLFEASKQLESKVKEIKVTTPNSRS
ncbi:MULTISPECIES: HEPN domain-containing protein [Tenacibaculum]|uniref:HEPN domain-containing protein n=1 Tax=Tenacibaculum TaxID=104267 RepID=UPI00069E5514|nr:HEPN domain-containing protein [Tenacibaculum mesophilum]